MMKSYSPLLDQDSSLHKRTLAARLAVVTFAMVIVTLTACAETPVGKKDLLNFLQAPTIGREDV